MEQLRRFLELIRFSHTVFALPFALLSATLAWRDTPFRISDLIGILLCMVFARSAAMAFNRLVDRELDAKNPRTAGRHLPAGLLSVPAVTVFTLICACGFVGSTALFLPNPWPLRLAIPVLLFLLGYSYAKRWTAFCHYWLSAALMLSPIAVWIALRGEVAAAPLWLAGAVFFWVGGFDILYAAQDADFDREQGLRSLPARWGVPRSLRLAAASHALTLACLIGFRHSAGLGAIFGGGLVVIALLLLYEHRLVSPADLSRVNRAFFHVNALISIGLMVIAWADLWWQSRV